MIAGVLLAAGTGERYGADKRLIPLAEGVPVAVAAARRLREAVPRAVAVVRPGDEVLAEALAAAGLEVVACAESREGMGRSLACGVAAAREAAGWVIALADMPAIRPATIARVAALIAEGAESAAPVHGGRRGHPVGFAARFRDELLACRGDTGARVLLERQAERLVTFATDDPGVLADVDTPADLERLTGREAPAGSR